MTHKIAYSFNENKEFSGECKAWKSPLEENIYHLPANSTFEKVLKKKEGFYIVWNGEKWEYKEIPKPEPKKPEPKPVVLTVAQKREMAYNKEFSNGEFQEALFEYEFEGKPEKLKDLQKKREEIKNQFPKN